MKALGALGYLVIAVIIGGISLVPWVFYGLSNSTASNPQGSTNYFALAIAILIDLIALTALARSITIMREKKEK